MKKIFSTILGIVLMASVFSCQEDIDVKEDAQASVFFDISGTKEKSIETKDYSNKGAGEKYSEYPACTDDPASYIIVTVDGVEYQLPMTAIDGQSQVLMTSPGVHTIEAVSVYAEDGTLIYVAPEVGTEVADEYGLQAVPFKIDILPYTKNKESVDVVCKEDANYRTYSWFWLDIHEYQIHQLCFFGNICTKFYEDFDEDEYDFIADFTVNIYSDGELIETASDKNDENVTCIQYLDEVAVDEDFTIEIVLQTPTGEYVIYSGELDDDGANILGDDDIFIFQVGNCGGGEALDYVAPAYLPIPETVSFKVSGPLYQDGYTWIEIKDLSPTGNYVFEDNEGDPIPAWCGDKNNSISLGTWYAADVYSSLETGNIPSAYSAIDWGAINWIINHKGSYTPQQIQAAIWYFTNGTSGNALSSAAVSGYVPLPGEDAVVIFDAIEEDGGKTLQLFIITVDP